MLKLTNTLLCYIGILSYLFLPLGKINIVNYRMWLERLKFNPTMNLLGNPKPVIFSSLPLHYRTVMEIIREVWRKPCILLNTPWKNITCNKNIMQFVIIMVWEQRENMSIFVVLCDFAVAIPVFLTPWNVTAVRTILQHWC